jgi:hypothetical protein
MLDLQDDEKRKLEAKKAQAQSPAPTTDAAQQSAQLASTGAPLSAGSALSVQTLAGNGAMNALVGQQSPGAQQAPVVQRLPEGEQVDTAMTDTDTTTGVMNAGVAIGTAANNMSGSTSGGLGTGGAGIGAGITGLTGVVESVRAGQQLKENSKKLSDAKTAGKKTQQRVFGRNVNKNQGDLGQGIANSTGAVSGITTSSMGVAGTLAGAGTHLATVGNVAGVVGATVTLPIQVLSLVRNSRRAELQRQRMNRVADTAKQMRTGQSKVDPEQLRKSSEDKKNLKKQAREGLEQHAKDSDKTVEDLTKSLDTAREELKTRQTNLTSTQEQVSSAEESLKALEAQGAGRGPNGEEIPVDKRPSQTDIAMNAAALMQLREEFNIAKKSVDDQQKTVDGLDSSLKEAQKDNQGYKDQAKATGEEEQGAESERARGEAMGNDMKDTGQLTDTGDKDKTLPTLKEIADYSHGKNQRGFARRTIGAVGAGLGVAAGAIGLAGAIEAMKGGASAGDLGIAAGVIGGLAALGGLLVAGWKIHNWRKKRAAQATKMAAAPGATKPTFGETYNPFSKKKVDQTTERKHMSTALLSYAEHGAPEERKEAYKIMTALDPKGPWAEKDATTGELKGVNNLGNDERSDLVSHFMDKMSSGS